MGAPRYLVVDVGATHTRVAVDSRGTREAGPVRFDTRVVRDGEGLLVEAGRFLDLRNLTAACVALAGPVADDAGRLTNGTLALDGAVLSRSLGCPVRVINDFYALSMSLPALKSLRRIGGRTADLRTPVAVKAVLGPGSGLGMGILIPQGTGWRALASEGGHGDMAPGNPLEMELLGLLQSVHEHVSWETVLSGPGLVNLYRGVCALWGVHPDDVGPEWIAANGVDAAEPVCHQTLEIFFGLLGSAAGNLALTAGALGGVYIGGGIVPALADFAAASPLRRRFEERGALSSYVADIPLWIILDAEPGLLGARCYLESVLSD